MTDHTHEAYDAAISTIDKTLHDMRERQATFEETNRQEHRELRNKIDGVRDAVDENYKLLTTKIENEIDKVEVKIKNEIDKVGDRIGGVEARIDRVEDRIDKVEARIDRVEAKIDKVNDKIDKVLEYMARLVFDQRQQEANRQANRVEQEANRAVQMNGLIWTLVVMSTLGVLGHIVTFFAR